MFNSSLINIKPFGIFFFIAHVNIILILIYEAKLPMKQKYEFAEAQNRLSTKQKSTNQHSTKDKKMP